MTTPRDGDCTPVSLDVDCHRPRTLTSKRQDAVGRHQRGLLDQAARTEERLRADRLDTECAAVVAEAAGYQRELAGLYAIDPTLEDEVFNARDRDPTLAEELCRQVISLARLACRDTALDCRPGPAEARGELRVLAGRLREAMDRARTVARADWASPGASREISLIRTRQRAHAVAELAGRVRTELGPALKLPYPAAEALDLLDLADRLAERAAEIAATYE
jgi:hypothetical protein